MKQIAFYGGTFDPVHRGHVAVGRRLLELFPLDKFVYLPAYHAPHKPDIRPASAYHRFAMLCLATADDPRMTVSTIELEHGRKRFTVETLPELAATYPDANIYFVMGADSWKDIRTWREWENVLLMTNHIVVTRPGYDIILDHVTERVRRRVVDLRQTGSKPERGTDDGPRIYITDAVQLDMSATEIRRDVRSDSTLDHAEDVPDEVAKYIEKYELYR